MTKSIFTAVACIAIATMFATTASAQQHLFSQYSTSGANAVNASAYPAPHPVPPYVGSSAYTYQPLMPHEMMYTHSRNYYNVSGGPEQYYRDPYGSRIYQGGSHLNVTRVRWQSGTQGYAAFPFSFGRLGQLKYKLQSKRYTVPSGFGASIGGGGGTVISDGGEAGGCLGCSADTYADPILSAPAGGSCASGTCGAAAQSAQRQTPDTSTK